MQFLHVIFTAFLLSIGASVPYAEVEKAFEDNSSSELVRLSKDKVLINILGKEAAYSKSQSGLVLKDFFTKNPGDQFNFFFKGKESSEGTFAIGKYISRTGEFRVTIHFKNISGRFRIESLTIEKS